MSGETEIKVYNRKQTGLVKLFFEVNDGQVQSVAVGDQVVTKEQGFQFYVDDYVADQIDKCAFTMEEFTPKLVLREGEELIIPTEEQRSEEHTSELQSRGHLVCRLLLEKNKKNR